MLDELLKKAGNLHLIASSREAMDVLSQLNHELAKLRLEANEAELRSDLYLNQLLKENKGVELQKSNWKVSEPYKEWKNKQGILSDIRAVRRNLESHKELLLSQEKYLPQSYKHVIE